MQHSLSCSASAVYPTAYPVVQYSLSCSVQPLMQRSLSCPAVVGAVLVRPVQCSHCGHAGLVRPLPPTTEASPLLFAAAAGGYAAAALEESGPRLRTRVIGRVVAGRSLAEAGARPDAFGCRGCEGVQNRTDGVSKVK